MIAYVDSKSLYVLPLKAAYLVWYMRLLVLLISIYGDRV